MKSVDIGDFGCGALPAMERCDAELPDSPECASNYHFGMLLGVEDFRAEQGFHVGRLRRHQRLLHGSGVVAGYPVTFNADNFEVRVGPGYAIDALGRDLILDLAQCVSLPRWWLVHREDDAFHDIVNPDNATFNIDVVACYANCLGSPVPAIAEPCAGDAADVAYSRICEIVKLSLVRTPDPLPDPPAPPFHLLRMWLGLAEPRTKADGSVVESDQWLLNRLDAIEAMPFAGQVAARAELEREVFARAVAEQSPEAPAHDSDNDEFCLTLARLNDVHVQLAPSGWTATVGAIELGVRESLLPTSMLQTLALEEPPPAPAASGPVVIPGGATINGTQIDLVFSQKLAPSSIKAAAFAVSEFVDADGWKPFTLGTPTYDESDPAKPTVHLGLDRAPDPARKLVRVTVIGSGSAPLLGANLIPAGAVHPNDEGRTLTISIHGS